jgi:hypothetical protein
MALGVRIDGVPVPVQRPSPRGPRGGGQVDELVRWAVFLDPVGSASQRDRERSAHALRDAADGDAECVHLAWLLAIRRLARGEATRGAVDLLRATVELVEREPAG